MHDYHISEGVDITQQVHTTRRDDYSTPKNPHTIK